MLNTTNLLGKLCKIGNNKIICTVENIVFKLVYLGKYK